ncbi:MAG: prenyltransferase [Acidimicrobiia bacterium]
MKSLWAFIRLSRPHFLLGGLLMFAVGAATTEAIDAVHYAVAQLMVSATQITAHYVNEYADVDADRLVENRTLFSGGSGVLGEGLLRPVVALRSAAFATAAALGAAVAVATYSLPAAAVGLAALGVSWSYSMPPARLVASGWGEITVSLVVAGAVPLVGALVQGGTPSAALWWSMAVLVPIHLAMILSFELPDVASDAAAGKRVLAVRIGRGAAVRLTWWALSLAGAAAAVGGVSGGLSTPAALATTAGLVPMTLLGVGLRRGRYTLLTTSAVATLVVVGLGLAVGSQLQIG